MILEGIASLFGGGLTGLLGTVISKVADFKTRKLEAEIAVQKYAHDIEMKKVDIQMAQMEGATRVRVAETDAAAKEAVADAETLKAAIAAEADPERYTMGAKLNTKQEWMFVFIDVIRALVRPGLTIYLCALTTAIYFQARRLMGAGMSPEEAVGLLKTIVNTVLYLTTTCVLFWFGTRSKGKPGT